MKGIPLNKWESTLNLCVHAHGYDVELIMKASCNNNYPLGVNSSCIYDWFPCDHGSDDDVLLWFQFSNNMGHLSSTSQRFYLVPPSRINPLVSRRYCGIAPPLMNSSWCDTSHKFLPIQRFWVVVNLEPRMPFARHPFCRRRRYSMASSETSRLNVSCSSSTFGPFRSVS